MELGDLRNALHVVHGAHTRGSLREAFQLNLNRILFSEDPISVGPAPATDDWGEWALTRRRFTSDSIIKERSWWSDEFDNHELSVDTERLGKAPAVVVWIAHGLPDQLLLALVVYLFDRLDIDVAKIWVVQLVKSPHYDHVTNIGYLRPEQIQAACPQPRTLTTKEIKELRHAWRVFTSSDPSDLSKYISEDRPLPLLHDALSQLVDRYPDRQTGLSIWDHALLYYAAEKGPKAVSAIGNVMGHVGSERLDYVNDDYLFPRLMSLGRSDLHSPLIKITGSSQIMRVYRVTITPFGEKVLAGEANHVEVNGIDDWVGGVHLSSAEGNIVYRDEI